MSYCIQFVRIIKNILILCAFTVCLIACQHPVKPQNTISDSPEALYQKAFKIMDSDSKEAIIQLEKMEQYYPSSQIIPDAQVLKAHIYYQYTKFDDAILTSNLFIKQYPQHKDIDYMYYLKALCYYTQIVDVGRDQKITYKAIEALQEVRNKFPHSIYAKYALWKEEYAFNVLAGKEMEIGRCYLTQGNLFSAINRFKAVLDLYDTTMMIPEALYRLVEAYYGLGIEEQALKYAQVLQYNFANNIWNKKAQALLQVTKKK